MKNIIINNISTSYYITEDGKCYNKNTGKYLKGQRNHKNGYFTYYLTLPNGKKTRQYIHCLVANAYLPKEDNKKNEVNHIDGDKSNNKSDNLEWVTQRKANEQELRSFNHVFCFTKEKRLIAEYKNIKEAAQAVNINVSIINQELNKEVKTLSGGFYWSKEPYLKEVKNYTNLGRSKPVNQYTRGGKYIMTYPSTGAAARALGLKSGSHIGECCRGKIKTFKGFVWRYIEDIVSTSSENQRDVCETS